MGFGRNTTHEYDYGSFHSRGPRARYLHGGSGPGSHRTWLSSIGAGQKMAIGSMAVALSPTSRDSTAPALRRWTWSSIHSADIEMQQPDSAAAEGENSMVKTNIVGNLKSETEGFPPPEDFGLRGINVHTSICTESTPVVTMLPPTVRKDERNG